MQRAKATKKSVSYASSAELCLRVSITTSAIGTSAAILPKSTTTKPFHEPTVRGKTLHSLIFHYSIWRTKWRLCMRPYHPTNQIVRSTPFESSLAKPPVCPRMIFGSLSASGLLPSVRLSSLPCGLPWHTLSGHLPLCPFGSCLCMRRPLPTMCI